MASPTTDVQYELDVASQYQQFAPLVRATYFLTRFDTPAIAFRTIVADSDTVSPALRTEEYISRWTLLYGYDSDDTDPPPRAE